MKQVFEKFKPPAPIEPRLENGCGLQSLGATEGGREWLLKDVGGMKGALKKW